jgi:hypothetical protein
MPKTLPKLTLSPRLGATHETALRISSQTMLYAQISGMAQSAPLEVTATAHGIPDGWQVAVIGAKGMTSSTQPTRTTSRPASTTAAP